MTSKLRIAAAAVTPALALGVAVPMTSAAEAARTPSAATMQVQAVKSAGDVNTIILAAYSAGTSPSNAKAAGINPDLRDAAKDIVAYIKQYLGKEYVKAGAAAKKGYAVFVRWVNSLDPRSPVRIVLEFGGKPLIELVFTFLI
ncbi:hypothetical protein [Streptomyces olivochromogenes]|uniref:Uncharacterized protein n=1 Tax=Streptomyces olivochromogenes TaxID=1963 RepID=A0A250VQQ7_STROL|nr:hypothetical protein [Streptomyces olivochromogenes]KUN39422.1 hypothetical protein AQJ27_42925 [Streptomyces olivochromogenes]GAX56419.1 hypothetical protein SO3561_07986 [Streptomyces olivochromogenes]